MIDWVAILEAPGVAELERAFSAALPSGALVQRLASFDALSEGIDEGREGPLIVVHERSTDGVSTGLELIAPLRDRMADAAIVFVASSGDVVLAQRAIQAGASDLLVLGPQLHERVATLVGKLERLFEIIARNRRLDEQNERFHHSVRENSRIVGESAQVKRLIGQSERVAGIPRPLLITGERGTGKELVARAIHFASERRTSSIVAMNCAAVGESLLESELFGHERGAFTGAERVRPGVFEQADGGTLFLDEIGNMPLPFQRKILRVVEYGTYTRVGGSREHKTSARIVAATNADLQTLIEEGTFLRDLYDRLAFEVIVVPPLRDRPGDIEILARTFLRQFAAEIPAFRGKWLSASALSMLRDYPFPGNIRELKNIIERAAYRDTTNEITPEDIGMLPRPKPVAGRGGFKERVEEFSRELIADALEASGGNQAKAARELGLTYDQFRHYRRKYVVAG